MAVRLSSKDISHLRGLSENLRVLFFRSMERELNDPFQGYGDRARAVAVRECLKAHVPPHVSAPHLFNVR